MFPDLAAIPTPQRPGGAANRDRPIDIEHYTSGAYGDLFRLGSDTSRLDASYLDREEGAFVLPRAGAMAQLQRSPLCKRNCSLIQTQ